MLEVGIGALVAMAPPCERSQGRGIFLRLPRGR
jgi:hypothetical protein